MFAVEVTFLTGRYVATAFDDRRRAEWPPHPARFFSALAATHFESPDRAPDERAALEWLEKQGAPEIVASDASARDVVTVFVPVNDTSVLSSLDSAVEKIDEARAEVEAARAAGGKKLASAEKKVAKATEAFQVAARKATEAVPPGKEGKAEPGLAASLLPEGRTRQPRTFPSVTPEEPRVVFAWPEAQPTGELRVALDQLTSRVVRLGHSSSLVSVRLRDDRPDATWVPDLTGEVGESGAERTLRVVESGQMAALDALPAEQAHAPGEPGRVMPAVFQRYVRAGSQSAEKVPTTVFGRDWIVLRRAAGPRLPSVRAVDVARTVRRALLSGYGPDAPEILSGHSAPGEPSGKPHLAIVPLPFVAHDRADGSLLGVAIVLPSGASAADRRVVARALAGWGGASQGDGESFPVHLGGAGSLVLVPTDERATLATLRPETWCRRATVWATATPIALDRNPGDLRSSDPAKEAAAYAAAEEAIGVACERIGLPRPAQVTAMVAAPLAGGDKVRHFPAFQAGKPPVQRVLVHAKVRFDRPVEGPILLGSGRYFGLGLLRPVDHG